MTQPDKTQPTRSNNTIPLFNLDLIHQPLRPRFEQAFREVFESQAFINGAAVKRLEADLARFHGVDASRVVGVSSGTDALLAALMALEIDEPGAEVITTPFTFVATAEVIMRIGAKPVFVDIDPDTLMTAATAIEKQITNKTRAIILVHLFGMAGDLHAVESLARKHSLALIEDCAQSMGAKCVQTPVGTAGQFGALSFFPTKNLGSFGDAGAVICANAKLANKVLAIRDHGAFQTGDFQFLGGNFRMDTLQAAFLEQKLPAVTRWQKERIQAAERYAALFEQAGLRAGRFRIQLPDYVAPDQHTYGLYVIRTPRRNELQKHLHRIGIQTGVYYPKPLHLQPCFRGLAYRPGDFPNAEKASNEVLAIPCFAGISEAQQQRVVRAIADFYKTQSK